MIFSLLRPDAFFTVNNFINITRQISLLVVIAIGATLVMSVDEFDLSVGSLLGFLGYVMAVAQARWIPERLGLGFDQPYTWAIALAIGIVLGAAIGAVQGAVVAYGGVPAFIVTLGTLLVLQGISLIYAPSSIGKVPSEIVRLYHGIDVLPRVTPASLTSLDDLLAQVRQARRDGYATDEQEAAEHVVGLAVAVPTRGVRSPVLAVSVTLLDAEVTPEVRARFVRELKLMARALGNPMAPA